MTPEQEASYEDEDWVNSTPKEDVQVQVFRKPHIKDILYKGSLDHLDMKTSAAIPIVKPSSTDAIMSHVCGDTPDKFASVIGTLLTPEIQNKAIIPHVPTGTLPGTKKQTTDALRRINATDPFLPSARVTLNHEFAIVPRQRSTTQLPPHMRLHEDIEDSPLMPVEQLVNAAILAFHEQHHRLPHRIVIAAIRYWRYRISLFTYNPDVFYYKTIAIPITGAPIGEFGIDEVRLD